MPSKRFIFRYRGKGIVPFLETKKTIVADGLKILDTSGRMILVEGEAAQQALLQSKLENWTSSEEKSYSAPKPVTPILKTRSSI